MPTANRSFLENKRCDQVYRRLNQVLSFVLDDLKQKNFDE